MGSMTKEQVLAAVIQLKAQLGEDADADIAQKSYNDLMQEHKRLKELASEKEPTPGTGEAASDQGAISSDDAQDSELAGKSLKFVDIFHAADFTIRPGVTMTVKQLGEKSKTQPGEYWAKAAVEQHAAYWVDPNNPQLPAGVEVKEDPAETLRKMNNDPGSNKPIQQG